MKRFYAIVSRDCGYSTILPKVLYGTEQAADQAIKAMSDGGLMSTHVDIEECYSTPQKAYVSLHYIWGGEDDEYWVPRTGTLSRVDETQIEYQIAAE